MVGTIAFVFARRFVWLKMKFNDAPIAILVRATFGSFFLVFFFLCNRGILFWAMFQLVTCSFGKPLFLLGGVEIRHLI